MNYRVAVTGVERNSPLADALDELDAQGNGAVEFDEGHEEDFIEFLEHFAGDAGEAFERMTITKVDPDDAT
jgi:hypothetical protein